MAPGMAGVPGFTFIVIALLVTVETVVHVAFEVITTVTVLPSVRLEEVYVSLFVPTFTPFTFH